MKPPTAAEKRFHEFIREKGCIICQRPASFHHEPFKSQAESSHMSGIALCPEHHQDQRYGRHAMSRGRFNETYSVDVLELARENWLTFSASSSTS